MPSRADPPSDEDSDEEDLPPWHWGPGLDLNAMDDDDVTVLSGPAASGDAGAGPGDPRLPSRVCLLLPRLVNLRRLPRLSRRRLLCLVVVALVALLYRPVLRPLLGPLRIRGLGTPACSRPYRAWCVHVCGRLVQLIVPF